MAEAALAGTITEIPAHVPPALVRDFDFHSDPGFAIDPFDVTMRLHDGPPVFFTPSHYAKPGCWVLTRAEDIAHVYQRPKQFSSASSVSFAQLIGEHWELIPVELDPPVHGAFRKALNPYFAPERVREMDRMMRATADELIGRFASKGACEFMSEFARPFPISIFMQILGLRTDAIAEFTTWVRGLMASPEEEVRRASMRAMVDYLRAAIEERRRAPRNDLISDILVMEVMDRRLTEDEIIGMTFLLFLAGLDTVASSLGFQYAFLAQHPEAQARLRGDRAIVPRAVEELLRMFSVSNNHRLVLEDCEVAGVAMKAGDWITLPTMSACTDPREFPDPRRFEPNRPHLRHLAFGFGPHRCLGVHLARRELAIALESWIDHVPEFGLAPGARPETHGGVIFGVDELRLAWR